MKAPALILIGLAICNVASATPLKARILLVNNEFRDVTLLERKPGASNVRVIVGEQQAEQNLRVRDVTRFNFDLTPLSPANVQQGYQQRKYAEVATFLSSRIKPYFAWADVNANSNDLISRYIRSLYFSGKAKECLETSLSVLKNARQGELANECRIYSTLSLHAQGQTNLFLKAIDQLPDLPPGDPLQIPASMAKFEACILSNDWENGYPHLAKAVTISALDYDWVGECLYRSADYHFQQTNLSVSAQILAELAIVDPQSPVAGKAIELSKQIMSKSEEIGYTLSSARERIAAERKRDQTRENASGEIDYRKRQRQLKETEIKDLQNQVTE